MQFRVMSLFSTASLSGGSLSGGSLSGGSLSGDSPVVACRPIVRRSGHIAIDVMTFAPIEP